jgi:adenylosuccinate lyase
MIARYTRPQMGAIWTDQGRLERWLEVELAGTDVLAERGVVPREAAARIRERARVDAARVLEIESRVRHDVIAFTLAVGEAIGDPEAARWLHYGLTSNDVVDTAQALQVREASRLIDAGLKRLGEVLEKRAHEFQHTPQIGRTHGIHAEPITFGLKIANWFAENRRNQERFCHAARQMAVGKISGAVGNAAHLGVEVEEAICRRLGLEPAPVASQVIQRDRHAEFLSALAIVAATLEKIAVEIRHLQRTEVREAEEPFAAGQRGSSAMPHKRNPVSCEQISGLARVVRANAQAALENVALWHERDISHSSVERIILPDSTILIDYMLARMTDILTGLRVFPERMQPGSHARPGIFRTASAGSGGSGRSARCRLPVGAGKRHGCLGSRQQFSRKGGARYAHHEIPRCRRARPRFRSRPPTPSGRRHLPPRLFPSRELAAQLLSRFA